MIFPLYSPQIKKIVKILEADESVTSCTCFQDIDCKERGKITCSNETMEFLHVRFDHCMISDELPNQPKRCDCVIFGFDATKKKQAMFVIEVKETYDKITLATIKAKLETCIGRMQSILGGHMNNIEVFPILTDERHSALCAQASMINNYKVRCYSANKTILVNKYQKNVVDYYLKASEKWQ